MGLFVRHPHSTLFTLIYYLLWGTEIYLKKHSKTSEPPCGPAFQGMIMIVLLFVLLFAIPLIVKIAMSED